MAKFIKNLQWASFYGKYEKIYNFFYNNLMFLMFVISAGFLHFLFLIVIAHCNDEIHFDALYFSKMFVFLLQ